MAACDKRRSGTYLGLVAIPILLTVTASLAAEPPQGAQQKIGIKTIYVIPSSHWDLGFVAPPEEILPRLKPHLDEVIANAQADPDFRWTVESVWQVREWLARTHDPKQIADFVALVNKGQIQLSAVFGSMHTEFMGAEELNRIVYDMKDLERKLGVKTDFAMMDDVPGFTLRLPQILARSGVKYFANGTNLFLFGGTSLNPSQVPFYWKSPDGSQVLTWQTQSRLGGYTEAMADYYLDPYAFEPYTKEHFYPKEWEGLPPLEIMQRGMDKLLEKYGKGGYPYDALMLLYLHDFIPSRWEAKQLLPAVREWNAAGKQPRIVVATPAEFFRHMEETYGSDKFPVYAGDWSGLWSEVKINSPQISADARWVHDHAPVAEALWSLLTFRNFTSLPGGNLEDDRLKILKYDEHSGAAQVGWPKLLSRAEVDLQNKEYADYARTSRADLEYLIDTGIETLLAQKPSAGPAVVVYNPLSWPRTDVVRLRVALGQKLKGVKDRASGEIFPVQRVSDAEIEFIAPNVPSIGYRTYELIAGEAPPVSRAPKALQIDNQFYSLRVRPSDAAVVNLVDKELGQELIGPKQALNQLLRWIPQENLPVGIAEVSFVVESGPVFTRLHIRRPGTVWPETQITLYRGLKRIAIANQLDRERIPFVASNQTGEYYSFDFPFGFSTPAEVWLEDGIGYHRIPNDYLPGARTDAAVPQHSLALNGNAAGKTVHVVLFQREAFFDYLPGLPGVKGKGDFLNVVRVTVMRKQDQGETRDLEFVNFATLEPGYSSESWYHFALSTGAGPFDPVAGYREGLSLDVPLIGREPANAMVPAEASASFFSLTADNVAVLAFKPSVDNDPEHYMLRLQEIAGRAADLELRTTLRITAAEERSMTEDQVLKSVQVNPVRVRILPHQTLTLQFTIPHPHKKRSERWWEWD